MNGNFVYSNPTKLYFGDNAISFLSDELRNYGPKVMLCYGGGSIKRNGIYDDVVRILNEAGKVIIEDPGVMSNPTVDKLTEGSRLARENNVDLIDCVEDHFIDEDTDEPAKVLDTLKSLRNLKRDMTDILKAMRKAEGI